MRLYVSGPMTGIEQYNYPAFHAAKAELEARGYEVLSPADMSDDEPAPNGWHEFLRRDIAMLLRCDGVATLPGWRRSRGASLEVLIARRLDMPIRPFARWTKVPGAEEPLPERRRVA